MKLMLSFRFQTLATLWLVVSSTAFAATRFDEFTKKFSTPAEPARVVAAGFQPDGTVVIAGVALGPVLELGVKETVLGKDAAMTPPSPAAKKDKKDHEKPGRRGGIRLM